MRQQTLYKIIGMQKDVADSGMDKQHAFDIRNMKFRNSDTNTVTALVNEMGNRKAHTGTDSVASVRGTIIGFTTLNDIGILFTHEVDGPAYVDTLDSIDDVIQNGTIRSTQSPISEIDNSNIIDSIEILPEENPVVDSEIEPPFEPLPYDTYEDMICDYNVEFVEFDNGTIYDRHGSRDTHIHAACYPESTFVVRVNITKIHDAYIKRSNKDLAISVDDPSRMLLGTNTDSITSQSLSVPSSRFNKISSLSPFTFYIAYSTAESNPAVYPKEYRKVTIGDTTNMFLTPMHIRFTVTILEDERVVTDYEEETKADVCDHIYLVTVSDEDGADVNVFEYFHGNLRFSEKHPIESTVYFENEKIQKVYWVDGINPLRYANIADKNKDEFGNLIPWDSNIMFESVPLLHLQEEVTITRNPTGGVFPSCTVQWCFTYLNRYGAESNIAWISPIYYSSPDNRGGKPGENCANSFTIRINKYEQDGRFDYIRLYHIIHTSRDQEVGVRRIADIPLPTERVEVEIDGQTEMRFPTVVFTDTNTTGEIVDPNELLYLGKNFSVIPNTIEQKSNTMFLGNLTQQFKWLRDLNLGITPGAVDTDDIEFDNVDSADSVVPADVHSGYYSHENQLKYSSSQITTFQRGEDYRLGFQAQDKTGRWSDVIWLNDVRNSTKSPKYLDGKLCPVHATYTLPDSAVTALRDAGYRKVRPVVVYPKPWERNIFTGGLLNPTVYNVKDRASNAPFSQSSWFLRPFSPINLHDLATNGDYNGMPYPESQDYLAHAIDDEYNHEGDHWWGDMPYLAIDSFIYPTGDLQSLVPDYSPQGGHFDYVSKGSWAEFRHDYPLGDSQQRNGEVQSMYNLRPAGIENDHEDSQNRHSWSTAVYSYVTPYPAGELRDYINRWSDFFYVDQSILTMNSADIEFDEVLQATSMEDCELKITGIIPMSSFIASYDIMTNTPPNKFYDAENNSLMIPQGLYSSEIIGATMWESGFGWKSLINGAYWHDELAFCTINSGYENDQATPVGFAIYPWHGAGSLNNDSIGSRKVYPSDSDNSAKNKESKNATGDNYISAELKTKILSNMHYSYDTFGTDDLDSCNNIAVKVATVLNEQRVSLTNIKEPEHSGLGTVHYFGSVDKLITPVSDSLVYEAAGESSPSYKERPLSRNGGYPIMASYLPYYEHGFASENTAHLAFYSPYSPIGWRNTLTGYSVYESGYKLEKGADKSMSSISIKYKSCNHIVVALDYIKNNTNNKYYQPYFDWNVQDTEFSLEGFTNPPFWTPQSDESAFNKVAIKLYDGDPFDVFDRYGSSYNFAKFGPDDKDKAGFLYYGQLFRKHIPENKFGGNTDEALEQNVWLPAGDAVYLADTDDAVTIEWSVGDTYYQRYDALRTYPFTEEDQNKVIDIVSFMTETHINIDGRYDKNRGLSNNNHCRPTNFNLMNYVYSQQDNFFTYHAMNPKKVHLDVLEYSFTWTLPKVSGALRDEWTRVTLASSHDCDGNKGPLNRIVRLDNSLVAFQSAGVAQILFNENVQIQASEGLPIELANSGKLQGLRYYTTEAGCQNKWSIAVAPNGIYWIDGRSKEFYMLSEAIAPLSTSKLMSTWFKNNADVGKLWNPGDWTGFFTHQDITTGELFLTSGSTALCYDTVTGEFSSFYDYQNTDAMFAIGGVVITAAKDRRFKVQSNVVLNDNLWLHRKSDVHCYFYNKQYPCSVEVVCNSNNQGNDYGTDKVFDNLEWRADAWELNENGWDYKPFVTFDKLSGSTNYQKFSTDLNAVNNNAPDDSVPQLSYPKKPVNLRKKFKIWHTTIPRAEGTKRDRIRDTWCHIKLELSIDLSEYRHILHDIIVTYFI